MALFNSTTSGEFDNDATSYIFRRKEQKEPIDEIHADSITSKYVILNLRFILRVIAFIATGSIIILQFSQLLTPHTDEFQGFTETFDYGGLECKAHRNQSRHGAQSFYIYLKSLSLMLAMWLEMKISVLFLPLFHGYWLYTRQEKLIPLRTTAILIAIFNCFPLTMLTLSDCIPAAPFFLLLSIIVVVCLLIDRIFVNDRDYYELDIYDDTPLLSSRFWEGRNVKSKSARGSRAYSFFDAKQEATNVSNSNDKILPSESRADASPVSAEHIKYFRNVSATTSKQPSLPEVIQIDSRASSAEKLKQIQCQKMSTQQKKGGSKEAKQTEKKRSNQFAKPLDEKTKDIFDITTSAEHLDDPAKANLTNSKESDRKRTKPSEIIVSKRLISQKVMPPHQISRTMKQKSSRCAIPSSDGTSNVAIMTSKELLDEHTTIDVSIKSNKLFDNSGSPIDRTQSTMVFNSR